MDKSLSGRIFEGQVLEDEKALKRRETKPLPGNRSGDLCLDFSLDEVLGVPGLKIEVCPHEQEG
ncbi:MAG TPA: hypothetical protein VMW89_03585, partial [Desulfatiglandales bacterium]|nr:hypothetical protein [Desulfatiglandales bacterium]